MKKESDDLYQLMLSLTPAEKRYCSLYLQKHNAGGDNRYLKLFNQLEKDTAYDSGAIRKKLGYEKNPNHYAVLKRQLYQQLLDGLYQYALFTNPEFQLLKGVGQCLLLQEKGLLIQTEKMVADLDKKARGISLTILRLLVNSSKWDLLSSGFISSYATVNATEDETRDLLKNLSKELRYTSLEARMNKMQDEAPTASRELAAKMKSIINLPEFSNEKHAITLSSQIHFYSSRALYFFHARQLKKSKDCLEKLLSLLENLSGFHTYAGLYRTHLANYLLVCGELKQYEALEAGLVKFKNIAKPGHTGYMANETLAPFIFERAYALEIYYLLARGKFEEAHSKTFYIRRCIEKYRNRIANRSRINMQEYMAVACFGAAKYNEAIGHLLPLTQTKELKLPGYRVIPWRMFQVLCHFETGNGELALSLIRAMQRKIRNLGKGFEPERLVLAFMHSALRKAAVEKEAWAELLGKLNAINKTTVEHPAIFSRFKNWARAHAMGISFAEAFEE